MRLITRASPLALIQAQLACDFLTSVGSAVDQIITLQTQGDRQLETALHRSGGKGLFVEELQAQLLSGAADCAVHSLKDMPQSGHHPDLVIAGIFSQASPWDCLVSPYGSWHHLPDGAVVGTSSLRRAAQILLLRPDLKIRLLRGNVGTRLLRHKQGHYDAIILACAGLERLQAQASYAVFDVKEMTPAFHQGVIGIECRAKDDALVQALRLKADTFLTLRVLWERQIAQLFKAQCHSAFGVHVHVISCDPCAVEVTVFAFLEMKIWHRAQSRFESWEACCCWLHTEFLTKEVDWSLCRVEFF